MADPVRELWSGQKGVASVYPISMGRWPDPDAVQLLGEFCRGKVCEIGCGTGRCAEAFPASKYIGVDVNPDAIEIAKKSFPKHKFEVVPWDDPVYPKGDTYLFYTVMLHVPDNQLTSMCKRVAIPGKRIVIFESMSRMLRPDVPEKQLTAFNRYPYEYVEAFQSVCTIKETGLVNLRSAGRPFFRDFLMLEIGEPNVVDTLPE